MCRFVCYIIPFGSIEKQWHYKARMIFFFVVSNSENDFEDLNNKIRYNVNQSLINTVTPLH